MRNLLVQTKKPLILGGISLILVFQAAAADINVSSDDQEIWLNSDSTAGGHDVNGKWSCSTSSAKITFSTPNNNGPLGPISPDSSNFQYNMKDKVDSSQFGYGGYEAQLDCGDDGTTDATDDFEVKKLFFYRELPDSDLTVYQGEVFEIRFNASNGAKNINLGTGQEYRAGFLSGQSLDLSILSESGNDISWSAKVPEDISPGERTLVTGISYTSPEGEVISEGAENRGKIDVKVSEPWQVETINITPSDGALSYSQLKSDLDSMNAYIRVTQEGEPVNDLGSDDFYVNFYGEKTAEEQPWLESTRLTDKPGVYKVSLSTRPSDLDFGSYNFEFVLDKGGGKIFSNFTVSRYIVLQGKITDAAGKTVNANIKVEKGGLTQAYSTKNGAYHIELLPGTYNFTLEFKEATARFEGVKLRRNVRDKISYDDIPIKRLEGQLEGVTVINSVAVTFSYPFESAHITMNYNPRTVSFQNAKVFECKQWLVGNCVNGWEQVKIPPSQVFPTVGEVAFQADPINITKNRNFLKNAFMVVSNTPLKSSFLELGSDRVPLGKTFNVNGKVIASGQPVGGVNVKVTLLKGGKKIDSFTSQTAEDGTYQVGVRVPEKEGMYSVKVEASKSPYSGFEKTLGKKVEVYTQRSLKLSVPGTVEFYPGKTSETKFTVENNGQAPVKKVKIHVNGLKNTWYTFRKSEWDEIPPGESRTALMEVEMPEGYCPAPCKDYPRFKVEVTGHSDGKINDIKDIQAVVTKQSSPPAGNSSSNTASPGLKTPGVVSATGEFLASQSSLNIALGLITIFILTLAGAIQKKKSGSGRDIGGRDRGTRSITGGGSSPPRVKPEHHDTADSGHHTSAGIDEAGGMEDSRDQPPGEESGSDSSGSGEDQQEDKEESGDGSGFECEVCGEEFDTESGLDLHRKALH